MICTVLGDTKMQIDWTHYVVGLLSALGGALVTYVTHNGLPF